MSAPKVVRVGLVKLGNIGSAPLLEFLLDERAERYDITVKVVGSGAKIAVGDSEEIVSQILSFKPDLAVVVSPNAGLPGPTKVRNLLSNSRVPIIVVSDGPTKKSVKTLEENGFGYLIVEADSMIGARREFLDPTEMALFNADLIKVLSITGVFNVLRLAIDEVIETCRKGAQLKLPTVIVDKEVATKAAGFSNEYAKAKAIAAYEIARNVAGLTVEGCFVVKEWDRYTRLVAAGHEMMRVAARLADEAREIEKGQDLVQRTPHHNDGTILWKTKLIEKPEERRK
jgi:methylenetetrahydromethanopterin dehydrogenase